MNLPFIKPIYDSLLRSKELVFSTDLSFLSKPFSYDNTFTTYTYSSPTIITTNVPDVEIKPITYTSDQPAFVGDSRIPIPRVDILSRANTPSYDINAQFNPFIHNELPEEKDKEEYAPFIINTITQSNNIEITTTNKPETVKRMPCPTIIRHLVISGGGELGFSFYSALRDSNISGFWDITHIETIYATSVGSIFTVLMALLPHFSWDIYDDFMLKRPWHKVFDFHFGNFANSFHKKGVFTKETMHEVFKPIFNAIDMPINITLKEFYEYTNIEIHIMTTELTQFVLVDLSYKTHPDWELLDAVYCSCGLPLLFTPHFLEDRIYLDGGFISNYPVNRCLAQHVNPDEILGFKRKFQTTDQTTAPKINTLFDYLFYIMYVMFTKVSEIPKSVKNQVEVYNSSPTINFYKMYKTFKSYDERVILLQDGVRSWEEFYEKTYNVKTPIVKHELDIIERNNIDVQEITVGDLPLPEIVEDNDTTKDGEFTRESPSSFMEK